MKTLTRMAGTTAVAAASVLFVLSIPASAQGTDLDCGDPGTSHRMRIDPNDDPNNLDEGGEVGVGCEDASKFGPDGQPTTTTAPIGAVAEPTTPTTQGHARTTQLARTGSSTTLTAVAGTSLVLVGALALAVSRRDQSRPTTNRS